MQPTDINPSPVPPAPEIHYRDETKKLSFWVSQCFILLATVLGVYLASSQGFRQALAYGEIQAARNSYYLRKSLQSEIADNLPLIREYMEKIDKGNLADRKAPFALDTFVWESMKNSSATLETPPELLRESRKFYRDVADIQQKVANNVIGHKVGVRQLEEIVNHMEETVLPQFAADLNAMAARLRQNGVTVE
ncbi:MAG: hypothetical protein LIP77_05940 [Planctomycetes bacterium]|nr:hypothetical protein [Planctomycetota bacterium]